MLYLQLNTVTRLFCPSSGKQTVMLRSISDPDAAETYSKVCL